MCFIYGGGRADQYPHWWSERRDLQFHPDERKCKEDEKAQGHAADVSKADGPGRVFVTLGEAIEAAKEAEVRDSPKRSTVLNGHKNSDILIQQVNMSIQWYQWKHALGDFWEDAGVPCEQPRRPRSGIAGKARPF